MPSKWRTGIAAGMLLLAGCGGGGGSGGGAGPGSPSPSEPPPQPPPQNSSPFTVDNPFALSGATSVNDVKVNDLRVFGDSYSVPGRAGTKGWANILRDRGYADRTVSYARDSARASSATSNSFKAQVDAFASSSESIGNRDLTVVYFGYNDILARDLDPAKSGYQAGVQRLVNEGATAANRRLFVTLVHDWGRNPANSDTYGSLTQDWNSFVRNVANGNNRVVAVDLHTVFERVFANPGAYGFNNVTTVDAGNSGVNGSALWVDSQHFGDSGLGLVARVYQHYLTRAWDWSNSLNAGSQATQRLQQDLNNGLLKRLAQPEAERPLGLTTLALGSPGGMPPGAGDAMHDPARMGFTQAHGAEAASGGIALDYGLDKERRFGVAIARYDGTSEQERSANRLVQDRSSDALALYWEQMHGDFAATTQFSYLQHSFDDRAHDDLLGHSGVNGHGGTSWALDQRLARPMRAGGGTILPWVSLGYQSHALDSYTATSLYTSDLRFSGSRASDVMTGIGLDMTHDAIHLGADRFLWLSGGVAYRTSLYRDDVEVEIREAAMPGLSQRETLARDRIERFDLSLDAVLGLAEDLNLRAAYGLVAEGEDHEQRLRLSLDYRF